MGFNPVLVQRIVKVITEYEGNRKCLAALILKITLTESHNSKNGGDIQVINLLMEIRTIPCSFVSQKDPL
jgi:hypothetical protein